MTVLNENLYVGTINQIESCQVWCFDGETNWTQVNENGFGGNNSAVQGIGVFDNELYVGTTNFSTGCEVLRYDGGITWTQVNENGFGSSSNQAIWDLTMCNDSLYAGTMNMGGSGCQIWRYDNDTNWTQVNESGFGNGTNSMVTSMTVLNGQLCAGTHNTTNFCEVWRAVNTSSVTDPIITPLNFKLGQNYPNPFNPETTISFNLTAENAKDAKLEIYNIKGQMIRKFSIFNIQSSIKWDGKDDNNNPVSSGVYLYRLKTDDKVSISKKMLLLR